MTSEDQEWYENQFVMFSSQGFKDLIQQVGEIAKNLNELRSVNTVEKLHNSKGQLELCDWLLNWETSVNQAYKALTNEDAV